MTVFVVDASHYQSDLPVADLRGQGFSALILKATDGAHTTDSAFASMLAAGRASGLMLAAYHFLEPGPDSYVQAQAAHCAAVVPADIPVWVDVEAGATMSQAYVFADALRRAGRRLAGVYHSTAPAAGYGGWWRAAYGSDPTGFASVAYQASGGDSGFGWLLGRGRQPDLWQFCERGRLSGFSGDVDFSAFRGTAEELRATGWFWSPPVPVPAPVPTPVPAPVPIPVPVPEEDDVKVTLPLWLVGGTLVLIQAEVPAEDGRPRLLRLFGGPANGTGRQYHDWADNTAFQVVLQPASFDFLHDLGYAVEGVDFNQAQTGWPAHGHELSAEDFEARA